MDKPKFLVNYDSIVINPHNMEKYREIKDKLNKVLITEVNEGNFETIKYRIIIAEEEEFNQRNAEKDYQIKMAIRYTAFWNYPQAQCIFNGLLRKYRDNPQSFLPMHEVKYRYEDLRNMNIIYGQISRRQKRIRRPHQEFGLAIMSSILNPHIYFYLGERLNLTDDLLGRVENIIRKHGELDSINIWERIKEFIQRNTLLLTPIPATNAQPNDVFMGDVGVYLVYPYQNGGIYYLPQTHLLRDLNLGPRLYLKIIPGRIDREDFPVEYRIGIFMITREYIDLPEDKMERLNEIGAEIQELFLNKELPYVKIFVA